MSLQSGVTVVVVSRGGRIAAYVNSQVAQAMAEPNADPHGSKSAILCTHSNNNDGFRTHSLIPLFQ